MLSAPTLLDDARAEAGLDDYGDLSFTEGLEVLVHAINTEAGLTDEYEGAVRADIVRVLVNRLRMHRDLVAHPEIADEEVLPPVFITSLPRTGSTKLHRMLAATGDFHGLRYWMAYNFAPFPDAEPGQPDPRVAAAEKHLQEMYVNTPDYQRYHPQFAEETEEELALLDAGFNSLYQWAAFLNVPSYIGWVMEKGGLQAFQDLRALLQYIQWQHYRGRRRRWVLKTPSLFGFEDGYAATFVGTDFIVTHREPVDAWPSLCGLFRGVLATYSDADFTAMAGPVILDNFAQASQAHLQWRDAYPAEKVLDVTFRDIVGDEIAVLQRVYDWLGLELTAEAKANVVSWLEMDAERGHERSTLTLDDFGLEPDTIRERLAGYYARYSEYL